MIPTTLITVILHRRPTLKIEFIPCKNKKGDYFILIVDGRPIFKTYSKFCAQFFLNKIWWEHEYFYRTIDKLINFKNDCENKPPTPPPPTPPPPTPPTTKKIKIKKNGGKK
jgi:hypothetical protein